MLLIRIWLAPWVRQIARRFGRAWPMACAVLGILIGLGLAPLLYAPSGDAQPPVQRLVTVPAPVDPQVDPQVGPTALNGSDGAGAVAMYLDCEAVIDAGEAPLHRGDPGYRRALDLDGDGLACEEERYR